MRVANIAEKNKMLNLLTQVGYFYLYTFLIKLPSYLHEASKKAFTCILLKRRLYRKDVIQNLR